MLRRTIIALCSLAMFAATFAVPGSQLVQAQTNSGLSLLSEFIIPSSNAVKNPHVTAARGQVTVTGNVNEQSAYVWTKAAAANAFGTPVDLGPAEGSPDWSTTSVATGPDGSTWVAWVNQGARTVYLRQRTPAGQWGPRRTVDNSSNFPVNVEVTVASNNQIFVFWRDIDRPIRYRFSTNSGENWSSRRDVADEVAYRGPFGAAAGPNGQVAVSFNGSANDRLQIFVGLWNGTSFTTTRVTPGGADYADSTVTFTPNGTVYAAWRGVATSGGNAGAFFAERQASGSWPVSRVVGGKVDTNVSISADEVGNLHMTWVGEPSGSRSIYYAFKPTTEAFRGPIASSDTGALYNPRVSGSIADATYGHSVVEEFSGSRVFTRYSLFGSNIVSFGGEPVVNDGATTVAPDANGTVKLAFRNLRGGPNPLRWRWGSAPTDAASDSNNWQSLTAEMRIPVPDAIRNATSCQPTRLYTQLRNSATNTVEPEARSVVVNLDGVVEASAYLENAFSQASAEAIQANGSLAGVSGAPGGADNYTRVPLTWVNIVTDTDCSGIVSAGVGATADKIEQTLLINNNNYEGLVTLPDLANLKPGPVPFVVRVADGAGNVRVFELEVILDEEKPVLNGGSISATASPDGDVLQNLSFENITVSDSQYPDEFWGVWIANAPEAVSDPLNSPELEWTVVEVPASDRNGSSFVLEDWSLATGLESSELQSNEDYFIYVRFLDGAGNPTDGFITVPVASSNLVRPEVNAPLITR
jgi:hypothetical protein